MSSEIKRKAAEWKSRIADRSEAADLKTMINVDPVELQKFSELAHRWWDPHSEFKPLHDINPLRLEYIDRTCRT